MKRSLTWFRLFTKRQLKRPSIIFILLAIIAMSATLSFISTNIDASIKVGFYITANAEHKDGVAGIIESLTTHDGLIKFIQYQSKNDLQSAVEGSDVEIGYAFRDSFYDDILNGHNNNIIEIISTPSNAISTFSDVIILANVMENMTKDMFIYDCKAQDFFENISDSDIDKINELYQMYSSNGSTFSFDYNALYDDYTGSDKSVDISSYLVTPIKGIIAIFIFITALSGGVVWFKDNTDNSYANIPLYKRPYIKLLTIFIPTLIVSVCGYLCLLITGIATSPIHELYVLVVYSIICILFSFVLSAVINENIYLSLIPVFILGSVICCPIFFNLANLIPAMKILQNLFLPTIYFML